MKLGVLAFLCCLGSALAAQDYVSVPDEALEDEAFYRLVACAAEPRQGCKKPIVRWSNKDAPHLTLRIVSVSPQYPNQSHSKIHDALDHAIAQINAAGTVVQITRVPARETPDIAVHLVAQTEGEVLRSPPDPDIAGLTLPSGYVHVWWDEKTRLTRALILFSSDIPFEEIYSIALEELLQSTGLVTDIKSDYYVDKSIFSEDGPNEIETLQGQDLFALQRHYPAR